MSDSSPTPPAELPNDVVETLDRYSPELLRYVARYAEQLAEYRERRERRDDEEQSDKREHDNGGSGGDQPDDVPSKATLTIKEINDNRYYYWQWRDGDQIKSKYKEPVSNDESD